MALNPKTVAALQKLGGCYIDYGTDETNIEDQACWSWALAGSINGVVVNPNDLIVAINKGDQKFINALNGPAKGFVQTFYNNMLIELAYETPQASHQALLETLVRCQGMKIAPRGTTNFEICMKYEAEQLDWTHWGINAYGHALETTPGCAIDLHKSSFEKIWHDPDHKHWVVKVNVEGLLPAQEAIIDNIIATIKPGEGKCVHECA